MVRTKQTARKVIGLGYRHGFGEESEGESEEGSVEEPSKEFEEQAQEHFLLTPIHLRENPTRRLGRNLVLPMRFGTLKLMGQKSFKKEIIEAIPDTGSEINAISLDCLRRVGGKIKSSSAADDSVLLGNGDVLRAVGNVTLRCSFAQGAPGRLVRKFLVFDHLLPGIQVLLGRPFLAFTETLTKHCNRLRVREPSATLPRMLSMSFAGQGLRCYIDSALTIAIADTGSDANLMRTDYAAQRKWQVEPVSEAERYVCLPGNRTVQLSGKIRVRFDLAGERSAVHPRRVASQNDRAISQLNEASGRAHDPKPQGQSTSLTLTFYLLDTLDSFVKFDIPKAKAFNLLGIEWLSKTQKKFQSALSRSGESAQVNATTGLGPDTSAITKFLSLSDISSLAGEEQFKHCMKLREVVEMDRRETQRCSFERRLTSLQAREKLGSAETSGYRLTFQMDEDYAQQAYDEAEQACRAAWEAWRRWLETRG